MAHHPDRVRDAADLLAGDLLHHRGGHSVGAARPGIDHLIVALTRGDQAVEILLLELLHLALGLGDHRRLFFRDHHIVLAERNARLGRLLEAQPHQAISENHALLLAAMAVDEVDHVRDELLGERAVDDAEGQHRVNRHQGRDHHPARRRGQPLHEGATFGINRLAASGDLCVHRQRAALQRLLDLTHIADTRRGHIIGGAVIRRLQ